MLTPVNQIYRFNAITDPDNPTVIESNVKLLDLVDDNDNIIFREENLNRGLVRYNIITVSNVSNTDTIATIEKLINDISYVPATVIMNLTGYENKTQIITASAEIIKVLTEKILKTTVTNVEYVNFENNIIKYTPVTKNGAVHINPNHIPAYTRIVNNSDILGKYKLLTNDPLVTYVLEELYNSNDYVPSDINVIYIENIAFVPIYVDDSIIYRINSIIKKKRSDGYFVYKIGIHNLEDLELITEMASLWNTKVIYSDDMTNIVMFPDSSIFPIRPELWYEKNILLVKGGQFPGITLTGEWQFHKNGHNQVFGKLFYKSILYYASILSYKKLGDQDNFVSPFTQTIIVNNDLSITIFVPTYNHAILFKKYLKETIATDQISTEPCIDLLDGIYKRWYVQSIDDRAIPMVLTQINEDLTSEEVLVFRSPVSTLYKSYDFETIDHKDLTDNLIKYYKRTGDVKELLSLVPVGDKMIPSNQDNNISLNWSLRGLYSVGPLKGLYEEIPSKILVAPKVGIPVITKSYIDNILYGISGDIYTIDINFPDNTVSPLFDIATEELEELKRIVNELWKTGYFLTYWVSAVQKYSDPESYSVIINNPILLYAADSKYDGLTAMNFLKNELKKENRIDNNRNG